MESQKCIWMEAGVVDYQLCPLKRNCDLCDFHKEMIRGNRSSTSSSTSQTLTVRSPDISSVQFSPGLQYLEGHFWYKRVAAGRIRIGIDAILWQLLSFTHKVIITRPGNNLHQDQCFGWIVLEGGIIYLKAPFSGKIIVTNPYFQEENIHGAQLYLTPEEETWLLEIEETSEAKKLSLTREQYLQQTRDDCDKYRLIQLAKRSDSEYTSPRIAPIDKHKFMTYLLSISNNRALIC
ncbi:MAG: hypothetical protein K9N35_03300 [Candidatus Marinimicrobia bacterium]|nr:hypothetical protein [Candidatus Neomarinimicrobiota bacterium]